ncbi:DUF72 domain-containing protein [Paenibacillus sp. LHD-117]|uniref:DUF72 domain-containing protein n=1 Tax=Paenibacillus sp. LHD-117 TaxID=3071412 RepID=UPI0027E186A6|nr:DUF72 domain-containing protein [Paenibacillus sp. LHD-117]MDQ6422718.1 DUF72 domain-containing protein [Paenibacillus sp. LHD-117]
MAISIGLAGWGDHDSLYPSGTKPGEKLNVYGSHFPVVEVDSTFYAIQPRERFEAWVNGSPASLKFVVKAYQGMTGHQRGPAAAGNDPIAMAEAFCRMLEPAQASGRLTAALFQYPPWFDCTSRNVKELRESKRRMEGFPCALEFRHQSWFDGGMRERTLGFMREEGWIHSVCDEPQAGVGSIPEVLEATDADTTIVRFHGRNAANWNNGGGPNWREVRYLYNYSDMELLEWKAKLEALREQSKEIAVIFNNNSGGHAAGNAKTMMTMLGQKKPNGGDPSELPPPEPEQLELF